MARWPKTSGTINSALTRMKDHQKRSLRLPCCADAAAVLPPPLMSPCRPESSSAATMAATKPGRKTSWARSTSVSGSTDGAEL